MYQNRAELFKAVAILGSDTIEGIYDLACGIMNYRLINGIRLESVFEVEIGQYDENDKSTYIIDHKGESVLFIDLSGEYVSVLDTVAEGEDIRERSIQDIYDMADKCATDALKSDNLDEATNSDLMLTRRMRAIADFFTEQDLLAVLAPVG
jgi:hypothetical protein